MKIFSKENHESDKSYKGFYENDKILIENEERTSFNELNLLKSPAIYSTEHENITIEEIEGQKLLKNYDRDENSPKSDKIEVLSVGRLH